MRILKESGVTLEKTPLKGKSSLKNSEKYLNYISNIMGNHLFY